MANLNDVFTKAIELNREIKRLMRLSTCYESSDLSGLTIDRQNGEQLYLLEQLQIFMDKLADAESIIDCLAQPIQETSRLHKNDCGRYETALGYSYTCGSPIEALITDEYQDVPYWTRTRVEHNGENYYLVGNQDISLNGLTVRVRKAV